jgi:hypothetical protein
VGFVLRRDLQLAIENARARQDNMLGSGPAPVKFRKIVDLAPITITDQVIRICF